MPPTTSPPPTLTLSEVDSKTLLADYGVPVLEEAVVDGPRAAVEAAARMGFPVVAKLCGDRIAHKTERGLVRLGLGDADAVARATSELLGLAVDGDGDVGVLVAPMVSGIREFIAGMQRDPQFGPTVLVGVGGVLAEAVADVAIGLAPLGPGDAEDMIDALQTRTLLGPFRSEPPVDVPTLVGVLEGLGRLAVERADVVSVDVNPLIVVDGHPVAVDALVEVTP